MAHKLKLSVVLLRSHDAACPDDVDKRPCFVLAQVPQKFRFPFYGELHWYVMERYVSCLTGKHFRYVRHGGGGTSRHVMCGVNGEKYRA